MCGVNQFWIIVFFTAVKPANNILFCIELIQRPESSRRHKLGLTDQSIRSNDDKTRFTCVHRLMTTGHSQNVYCLSICCSIFIYLSIYLIIYLIYLNIIPTVKHGDGLGLLCSFRTWMTCHNWWNHEFCTLSENPEGECPAISLWPQAQTHLGYAAGQWSKTHQQVHLWWLKNNKIKVLEWPSQSPGLNPIEMLWHDLKQSIHARKPSNVAELKQFCKEEWDKIHPQQCERLIASYRKCLIAVVAAKGGTTSY